MAYCPKCRTPFVEGVTVCSECQRKLVEVLGPNDQTSVDTQEVYRCYDRLQADLVCTILLNEDIECFVRDMTSSSFPTAVGSGGELRIAVEKPAAARARTLLVEAIESGEVAEDGALLGGEGS